MKNSTIALGAAAIAVGTAFALPSVVSAYRGDANAYNPNCPTEVRELMDAGRIEEANQLRQQLGLGMRDGSGPYHQQNMANGGQNGQGQMGQGLGQGQRNQSGQRLQLHR